MILSAIAVWIGCARSSGQRQKHVHVDMPICNYITSVQCASKWQAEKSTTYFRNDLLPSIGVLLIMSPYCFYQIFRCCSVRHPGLYDFLCDLVIYASKWRAEKSTTDFFIVLDALSI